MGWLLSSFLETRMLARDAALSRDFVQGVADTQQVAGFFRSPEGDPAPSVTEFFAHVAAMPDVLRANVYSPTRRVLWSSRPELIGKTFVDNDELDAALRGHVVVNREEEDETSTKGEHQGLSAHDRDFVENYLPVFDEHDRSLVGVIELYRRPGALLDAIEEGQWRIRIGAAGGGAFLFAVLVWFVRRTERALQTQQERLMEAEALAVAGELSAAVAHSIRNPLVSIRTSAELQRELHGDADGVQVEIMRNVDRIEHLIRTLLTYAGDPAAACGRADVGALLREAAERFAPDLHAHDKRFELDLDDDLGVVDADPVILAQVFNSLLANAAEATSGGGGVRLSARRDGPRTSIAISDDGTGIAPEHLRDIFKPFFTTKPRGLGVGLPLARRIVLRLGGELRVERRSLRGTLVQLHLPLIRKPE